MNTAYAEHIKSPREENEKLRQELSSANHLLDEDPSRADEAGIMIEEETETIDMLRFTLQRVYEMVEIGCSHEDILAQVNGSVYH